MRDIVLSSGLKTLKWKAAANAEATAIIWANISMFIVNAPLVRGLGIL